MSDACTQPTLREMIEDPYRPFLLSISPECPNVHMLALATSAEHIYTEVLDLVAELCACPTEYVRYHLSGFRPPQRHGISRSVRFTYAFDGDILLIQVDANARRQIIMFRLDEAQNRYCIDLKTRELHAGTTWNHCVFR